MIVPSVISNLSRFSKQSRIVRYRITCFSRPRAEYLERRMISRISFASGSFIDGNDAARSVMNAHTAEQSGLSESRERDESRSMGSRLVIIFS